MRTANFSSHRAAGFSLVEILVVIVIIAILTTLLLPRLTSGGRDSKGRPVAGPRERARQTAGTSYAQQINTALQMYRDDNEGQNPPSLADLKRYGIVNEMLRDQITGQPLSYDPRTGTVGASRGRGGAVPPTLPRTPGY